MAPTDKREEPGMDHPNHAAAAPRGRALVGTELAGTWAVFRAAVVLPLLIGAVLDNLIHTAPLLLFVGLVIGIVAGGAVVYTRFNSTVNSRLLRNTLAASGVAAVP